VSTAAVRARIIAGAAADALVREFEGADLGAAAALPVGGRREVTGRIDAAGAPGCGTGAESRRGEGKREEEQDFGPWVDHVASRDNAVASQHDGLRGEDGKVDGQSNWSSMPERGEQRAAAVGAAATGGAMTPARSHEAAVGSSSLAAGLSSLHLATAPAVAKEAEAAKGRGGQEERGEREGGRGKHDTPATQSRQIQAQTDTLTDRGSGGGLSCLRARKPLVPPRSEHEEPEAAAPATLEILGESSDANPRVVSCASAATDARTSAEAEEGTEAPAAAAAAATTKRLPVWRQRQRQRQEQQTHSLGDEESGASAVECAHQNPGGGCGTEGDAVAAGGDTRRGAVEVPSSPARRHLGDAQKSPATPAARAEQGLSGPLGALLAIAAANTLNPHAYPAHRPPSPPPSPPPPPPIASSSANGVVASAVSATQTLNLRN
jgi:hypothetical protein